MSSKLIIVLVTLICMVGCTTMRPVENAPSELSQNLEMGDKLTIYEKTGRIYEMTLTEMSNDSLHGIGLKNPVQITVQLADIEKIEVEKIDGVKTTVAVIGGLILIVPIALLAGLMGMEG